MAPQEGEQRMIGGELCEYRGGYWVKVPDPTLAKRFDPADSGPLLTRRD